MTVTFHLPPAVERELTERATKSGQTLAEYLQGLAVREAVATAEPTVSYPPGLSTPEERSKALREWAASHPRVEHFVDDSRESLYDGRGE